MQPEPTSPFDLSSLRDLGASRNLDRERASTAFQEYSHANLQNLPLLKISQ